MRAPVALAVAALLGGVFVAAPARAGDPPAAPAPVDLSRRDSWRVGDVVTVALVEQDAQTIRIVAVPGGAPVETRRASALTATWLAKCLLADGDGNATRTAIFVREWSLDNGRTKDTSLAGARLEARGRGKDRAYGILANGPAGAPSPAARLWLDGELGPGKPDLDALRRAWLPKAPVAVGATWNADLGPLLETLLSGKPIDREKATSVSRLAEVRDGVAVVRNEAAIPLTAMPAPQRGGATLPWTKGGAFAVKGEMTVPLAGRLAGSRRSVEGTLEGEAEKGGKTLSVSLKFDVRRIVSVGGEFPADPAPPPTPAMEPTPPAMEPTPPGK